MKTGLNGIDSMLGGGLKRGRLYMVVGGVSSGKTEFGIRAAVKMAADGKYVLFVSMEQTAERIIDRIIAYECGIELYKLKTREGLAEVWDSVTEALDRLRPYHLMIDTRAKARLSDIAEKARKLKAENRLDVLIIDSLGLISGGTDNISLLAKELDIPLIALCNASGDKPSLYDIKESDKVIMSADTVLALQRGNGWTDMVILRSKGGKTGILRMEDMANG